MIQVTKKTRLGELKLEAGLIFLSLFYFVIATNTQTGWLFVLSAFLLGVLLVSFSLTRGKASSLELRQTLYAPPQRGQSFRVKLSLTNCRLKTLREVKVEITHPPWAVQGQNFAWAVPLLAAGDTVTCEYRLTPNRRGEHRLGDGYVVCGAPFGLFAHRAHYRSNTSFLVYPPIKRLPAKQTRSRLATQLGELISPKGLGDSRNLRSLREYRDGDDLRHVHWKASAKRSAGSPLLVKEHHCPAPSRTAVVLDNSALPLEHGCHQIFETAVEFATSILWSAHREGAQTILLICTEEKGWTRFSSWAQQYRALAGVQPRSSQTYQEWLDSSQVYLQQLSPGGSFSLIKPGEESLTVDRWPAWASHIVYLIDPTHSWQYPTHSRLLVLDGTKSELHEVSTHA